MEDKDVGEIQQVQALQRLGSSTGLSTLVEADKMANLALTMAIEFTGATSGYLLLYNDKGGLRYRSGVDPAGKSTESDPPKPILKARQNALRER